MSTINTIEELRVQNEALERSPEYQRIIPKVMRGVYTRFVNERIEQQEKWLEMDAWDDPFGDDPESMKFSISKRIEEAKRSLTSNPEQAAELFMQLGCCHNLWALQKRILKEKYGITWYTPSELNPDVKFD